jgi:hypothetical protein
LALSAVKVRESWRIVCGDHGGWASTELRIDATYGFVHTCSPLEMVQGLDSLSLVRRTCWRRPFFLAYSTSNCCARVLVSANVGPSP